MPSSNIPLSGFPLYFKKGETTRTEQMIRPEKPKMKYLVNNFFSEPILKGNDKNIFAGEKSVHCDLLFGFQ